MSMPTYEEIMLPLLRLIADGKMYNNKYCEEKLANEFGLTDEDLHKKLQGGAKVFYNRFGWAKTYLKNACLIEFPRRGSLRITQRGQELLERNPIELNSKYLMKYKEFQEFLERSEVKGNSLRASDDNGTDGGTPFEKIDEAFNEIRASLAEELLQKLKTVDFYKFEEIVLDLLVKMGYGGSREEAKKATKKTNDEGIDGIINEDRLGLDRIYVQAKRWKDTIVGRPEIQKFSGALDTPGANKGIFITTSTFSGDAIEYAKNLTSKKIILIDGYQLAEFMIDFNVGVSIQETYEIKRLDTDYFEE